MPDTIPLDAVIFGGGAAGLWLLDELHRAGRSTLLLEAHELGSGQTIASQGIIHGGLKYTLSGLFTPSAKAISEMPAIWRRCLAGETKPDLSSTRLRADYCHLWRTTSLASRLAMIGARAGLRVSPVSLQSHERPLALADCPGVVARLDEQVIEPASMINNLREQHRARILKIDADHGLEFECCKSGVVDVIKLINPQTGDPLDLRSRIVIFAAGAGNAGLCSMAGLSSPAMQRRPLHMVMIRGAMRERGRNELPLLNGHCVDGSATRVTITTTRDYSDRIIWQVGGRIAEAGVNKSPRELVTHARNELEAVLPSVEYSDLEWSTYRVDRAEPATGRGARPDDAHAMREGNVIIAWPTKLALVPEMARRAMVLIPEAKEAKEQANAGAFDVNVVVNWPQPIVALPPWETVPTWFADI